MDNFKPDVNQFNADANLLAEFEQSEDVSGNSFHYTQSVKSSPEPVSEEQITAYLSKIQRGGLIQAFGCLLVIEEPSFKILAYSKNTQHMLGLTTSSYAQGDVLLGNDARTLFTESSAAYLTKFLSTQDFRFSNPVLVVSETSKKSFFALLHRIDVGVLIDLEPSNEGGYAYSADGAVVPHKFELQAISRLESVTRGDIDVLCSTLIKDLKELTGYDRIMVYKLHEDQHGEVVSEIKRSDLEPYMGLHYPATDIPQVARFLFKKNRIRMIHDINATPVGIIQSRELEQPLLLVNSVLRAPHDCHVEYMANMGSIASLVMAIIVNENDSMKLWGLVSCHHQMPRYIPFSIRCSCQVIMQAFASQLSMELQFLLHMAEKKIHKTHSMLCSMLVKDAPFGIVTKSPNIMDLVNCSGAAFYYNGVCRILGVTPSETQIKDITEWLLDCDKDLSVWSTDSLVDSGYPSASDLCSVCSVVVARITTTDFLFWFRPQTEKEIRWGGAKQILSEKDDGKMMHPRSSFQVFLEVVKNKSLPWEKWEINAVRSLQHSMQGSFQDIDSDSAKVVSHSQQSDSEVDKDTPKGNEMVRLLETALAPIFAVDSFGYINNWNSRIADLTGLPATEAIGKSMVDELLHKESHVNFRQHFSRALQGKEDKNIEMQLKILGGTQENEYVFIVANACTCKDDANSSMSVWFIGQDVTEAKVVMLKFLQLEEDYKSLTQSVDPLIPPMFFSDESARCSEWNASMEILTGLKKSEVIGKMIPGEIFGGFCKLKSQDDVTKLMILFYQTLCSETKEKLPFSFFNKEGTYVEVILTTKKRIEMNGHTVGCFCFLQTVLPNSQQVVQGVDYCSKLKDLVYIREEIKYPLSGIEFAHKLLKSTHVLDDQKLLLDTIEACQKQMMAILETADIEGSESGSGVLELNTTGFLLESVMLVIASQVKMLLLEKNLHLLHEIPETIKTLSLRGDKIRLQQILSNLLVNIVHHTPTLNSFIEVKVDAHSKMVHDGHDLLQLHLRMIHQGQGIPSELIHDMFHGETQCISQEGFGLKVSRKLLNKMNGDVQYIREPSKCYFLLDIEFETFED